MKVIDLLQRIANKKDIPKVVKILDNTLLPDFRILEWNETLELYEHIDKTEFNCVLDKYHLDLEVDIIGETSKEDKKIEKLNLNNIIPTYTLKSKFDKIEKIKCDIRNQEIREAEIQNKINEIIDRLNGEDNE